MDNYKGVLVCGEIVEGKLAPVTVELLGAGRKLANDLGEELSILLMGSKAGALGSGGNCLWRRQCLHCRRCSVGRIQL